MKPIKPSLLKLKAVTEQVQKLGLSAVDELKTTLRDSNVDSLGLSVFVEMGHFLIERFIDGKFNASDMTTSVDEFIFEFTKTLVEDPAVAEAYASQFTKVLVDNGFTTDVQKMDFFKTLVDVASVDDHYSNHFSKPLTDEFYSAEDHAFIFTKKARTDQAGASEQINKFEISKPLVELPSVHELWAFNLERTTADAYTVDDAQFNHLNKGVNELSTLSDTEYLTVTKVSAEHLGLADVQTWNLSRYLTEQTSLSDAIEQLTLTKVLQDTVTVTDDIDGAASILDDQEMVFIKHRTEQGFVGDSLHYVAQFSRDFTDTTALSDAQAFSVTKTPYDTAATADAYAAHVQKPFTDSSAVSEASVLTVAKPFAESAGVSDVFTRLIDRARQFSETALFADTGRLISQGYVTDAQYFEDDYVGASRTF